LQNNTGQSFVYDAAGRLAKVKNQSGGTLATYTYGASNRRLLSQTGSETSTDKTYYIWEGDSVIAEYIEQTTATMPKWSKNYIYLGGRLLATEAPNSSGELVQYHHPDRLGTKLVTNNLDTTSFSIENLPFGTALNPESNATNRRFTSYDRSATTGLDYAVNRHYDPRQGRFTQVDPLGMAAASLADPQTLNMYSYVGNDPVNRVDPDGQFWGALFRFIVGLFTNLKPNVINGSFTFQNTPPISVAFTPNFQNIGVGFAGIGFDLRAGGYWLPALLGAGESVDPQRQHRAVVKTDIRIVDSSDSFDAVVDDIVAAILDIANNQKCSDVFKKYGLRIPYDSILGNTFRIAPSATLFRQNAAATLGITQAQVEEGKQGFASNIPLVNQKGAGFKAQNGNNLTMVFNANYFKDPVFGGLKAIIIHEFIHAGGRAGGPIALPYGDLNNFKNEFEDIYNVCK
jgi:RHS repeat-associated protein